jgi:hypothetical protein
LNFLADLLPAAGFFTAMNSPEARSFFVHRAAQLRFHLPTRLHRAPPRIVANRFVHRHPVSPVIGPYLGPPDSRILKDGERFLGVGTNCHSGLECAVAGVMWRTSALEQVK